MVILRSSVREERDDFGHRRFTVILEFDRVDAATGRPTWIFRTESCRSIEDALEEMSELLRSYRPLLDAADPTPTEELDRLFPVPAVESPRR